MRSVSFLGVSYAVFFQNSIPNTWEQKLIIAFVCCFFEDIYKFIIACKFISPMYEDVDVGDGFSTASIKSSATLVAAS